ncbi:MAG: lipopolysaccharide biosynthesis protein [Xanthobacteraceae bacterium]
MSRPLILMALRVANTAAKFLLALYTARYLGLADLGVYGLLVGGTILTPALLGLGTGDWVMRQIVTMSHADALAAITTRLALPVVMHAIVQPLLWILNGALGTPVPWPLVAMCGLILMMEHVANDASDLLIARNRALLANVLMFLRGGLWPIPIIVWGLLDPTARTLNCLLLGWIGGLTLLWLIMAVHVAMHQRWHHMRLRWRWLASGIGRSLPFYIKDMAAAASLHLDRFLISLFLGLELTGVYTLFWSITNVVHNLTVYSVVHPQVRTLIAAREQADDAAFQTAERRILIEASYWTAALALGAAIFAPILFPLLDRPALQHNVPIFFLILIATLMRIGADCYGFMLLVLHRDHAIAVISVAGAITSAALNVVLIPLFGLSGAALAYLLTGAGLLAVRVWIANAGKAVIAPAPARST